jgi:two-component system, NarL family, response regulator NreC
MITIVLVEDHHIVRQGLKMLLESEADFDVIGEASDGLKAVEITTQLQPNVLVIDVNLPSLNGVDVISNVKAKCPDIKAIILSMHASDDFVVSAFANGASGYVLKDSCAEDLVTAIQQVLEGNRYLSPELAERAIDIFLRRTEKSADDPFESLSQRERQVIQLSAEGYSYGEIANQLFISPRTAETHRTNAMRKLGLNNTADLVRYTIRRGLISVD